MKVSVKAVKIHDGLSEETMCFEATLYIDGKKAASASNRGQGGCNEYHFIDAKVEKAFYSWTEKQEMEFDFEKEDQIVSKLVIAFDEDRWCKRKSKTKTLFRLKGDAADGWRTLSAPYCDRVKAFMDKKYGDTITTIYGVC